MSDDLHDHLGDMLAHRAWVAALARSLVFDQSQVDDVVQETWMVAMRSKPRDPDASRAWLGGIVRRVVMARSRTERRRRRRETRVAVPVDATIEGDVVEQTELHRQLVDAVLQLDEPYRTTVILRYFHDLQATEIAEREGVTPSTVRTRMQRALEKLRRRLDETTGADRAGDAGGADDRPADGSGGARRAWMLALLPLAMSARAEAAALATGAAAGGSTGVSSGTAAGGGTTATGAAAGKTLGSAAGAATTGAMVMGVKTKLAAGAVAVAAVLWGTWSVLDGGGAVVSVSADGATHGALPVLDAASDDTPTTLRPTASGPAVPLRAPDAGAGTLAMDATAPSEGIRGRLVDAGGAPVADAAVRFAWHSNHPEGLLGSEHRVHAGFEHLVTPTRQARSADDGRFELPVEFGNNKDGLDRTLLVVHHPDHVTRLHVNPPLEPGRLNDLGTIALADGVAVTGRIVDERGDPVAGAAVRLLALRPDRSSDVHGGGDLWQGHREEALRTTLVAATADDGRFRLTGLPAGEVDLALTSVDRADTEVRGVTLRPGTEADVGTWTLPRGRRLAGVVRHADGRPAEGAQLYVLADDAPYYWDDRQPDVVRERVRGLALADEKGRFLFGGLADRTFTLFATTEGATATRLEGLTAGTDDVEVVLEPPGRVLLRVEDSVTGEVIGDGSVLARLPPVFKEAWTFFGLRGPFMAARPSPETSDAYLIDGVGREGARLRVNAEGYASVMLDVDGVPPGATQEVQVELARSAALTGLVVDRRDEPVANASVQMHPKGEGAAGRTSSGVRTDADGAFRLDGEAGDWSLWVNAPGFADTSPVGLVLPDALETPFVVRLLRTGVLEGVVRDADGSPAPGVAVVALSHAPGEPPAGVDAPWDGVPVAVTSRSAYSPAVAHADETGTYRFLELTQGTWTVLATRSPDAVTDAFRAAGDAVPADLPDEAVVVTIGPDALQLHRALELAEGSRVTGIVSRGGSPVAGARVLVAIAHGEDDVTFAVETRSDEDGRYALELPQVGPAILGASVDGGYPRLVPVTLEHGEDALADVRLDGVVVTGRVVDATSRVPIGGAEVSLVRATGETAPVAPGIEKTLADIVMRTQGYDWIETTSDEDGSFVLLDAPAMPMSLITEARGHLRGSLRFDLAEGRPSSLVVELARAAILTGEALDDDGEPLHAVSVGLVPHGSDGVRHWASWTGEPGRWEFASVDAGAWEVRLVTQGPDRRVLARRTVVAVPGRVHEIELVAE